MAAPTNPISEFASTVTSNADNLRSDVDANFGSQDTAPPHRAQESKQPKPAGPALADPTSGRGRVNHDSATLMALSISLSAVMLVSKLWLLPFPVTGIGSFVRWALRLAIVAAPDLCFAAGLGFACWLVSACFRHWPRVVGRGWRWGYYAIYAGSALYAIASIPMFKVTMVPFSIRLLSFAGGPDVMISSVQPFVPPLMMAALLLAPLAVLAAPWCLRRWPQVLANAKARGYAAAAMLVVMPAYGTATHYYVQTHWTDPNRWERRIAQSPHWVLLYSCLEELAKQRPLSQSYSFAEIDDSDFRGGLQGPPGAAASSASANDQAMPAYTGQRAKNILLIVMESTGVEYFGVQGSKYATTPHLDKLARDHGVVFENIYTQAASSCKSLVSLSASVYPRPDWLLIVRDHPEFNVPTIAELLKERGYRTCYAHAGYWSWQKRDRFLQKRGVDKLIGAEGHEAEAVNSWGIEDNTMYQEVLDWIDQGQGEPFFALAYTIETHHPYVAPAVMHDFKVKDEELSRYLNAVRAADQKIAWLIEQLNRRGLGDSTVVAVTADHGESFGQHNQRTHSFGVYEQTVHVPLVLLYPGLADMPRRSTTVGQHIDIAPTLLEMVGVPAPKDWQGRSLLDHARSPRAYFLSVGNEVVLGLRDGRYKYHYYVDTTREELFDLETDPAELKNLALDQPDRCAGYRSRVGGLVTYQRGFLARHGVQ